MWVLSLGLKSNLGLSTAETSCVYIHVDTSIHVPYKEVRMQYVCYDHRSKAYAEDKPTPR